MSVCWKLKYARRICNINTRCLHTLDIPNGAFSNLTHRVLKAIKQEALMKLMKPTAIFDYHFSTNSSLVGPCILSSLSHTQPPCFDRSSIFSGLRRRSYAKQAKLRHYPLANQRFLRSVCPQSLPDVTRWPKSLKTLGTKLAFPRTAERILNA